MSRGQGLEYTKKYKWVKQPNGRYTIFDVPIFATFQDEKRGEVTDQDLADVIKNFQYDKLENYRYPRVHIGHHNDNENRVGAGYMDNCHLQKDTIYADLVEITPEIFNIWWNKKKFPYVSAEYHPEKKKILSLALLESQSPFFSFPLIDLDTKQATVSNFSFGFPALILQENPEQINNFQVVQAAWACRDVVIKFQENYQGCNCMPDPTEDKKEDENINPSSEQKEPMTESAPKEYKCQDDFTGLKAELAGLKEEVARIASQVNEIYGWEKSEHEGDMQPGEMGEEPPKELGETENNEEEFALDGNIPKPPQPMKGLKNPMKKPSSVAFQADNMLIAAINSLRQVSEGLVGRMDTIEKGFATFQEQQRFAAEETSIQHFCESQGLDFQEQMKIIKSFSTAKERKAYMDGVSRRSPAGQHPAMRIASTVAMNEESKVLEKFQMSDPETKQRAIAAMTFWKEVQQYGSEADKKHIQCVWTDKPDRFVTHCANNPGALDAIKGE